MANINLSISVADDRGLQRAILEQLSVVVGRVLRSASLRIKKRVGDVSALAIKSCPEYNSLLDGQLKGELGIVSAGPVLEKVVANISAGVVVTELGVRVVGTSLDGGLRIEFLKGDYSEVLGSAGASFQSEGGHDVAWLRWLTLEGDKIIVFDHRFAPGYSSRSRTGLGVMSRGGRWRVPPEFAGNAENNWLVRALVKAQPAIEAVIGEELQRSI